MAAGVYALSYYPYPDLRALFLLTGLEVVEEHGIFPQGAARQERHRHDLPVATQNVASCSSVLVENLSRPFCRFARVVKDLFPNNLFCGFVEIGVQGPL